MFTDPKTMVEKRRMRLAIQSEKLTGGLSLLSAQLSSSLEQSMNRLILASRRRYELARRDLLDSEKALILGMDSVLSENRKLLAVKAGLLDAYSPLKVMEQGYSVVSKGEEAVNDAGTLQIEDEISVRFFHGSVKAIVSAVERGESDGKETDI